MDEDRMSAARREFDADVVYLNTATLGLPLRSTLDALRTAQDAWRAGRSDALGFDESLSSARASYGRLVGAPVSSIAVGSQVSVFVGLVAASLPSGSEVLTAQGDFTSVLFPFYVQAARGVHVREVPLEDLPGAVTSSTTLVAVSAVQSADGRVADLEALEHACREAGTPILLDTTRAIGWLPIQSMRYAYTVCGGYKWLLSPRGTAYFTVQPDRMDQLLPHTAGWYAGQHPWESIYGAPLRLSAEARRFDVSPAWHAWVGAAPALDLLADLGPSALHRHATGLANRFRDAVGLPSGDSAIVSLDVTDGAEPAMREAAVVASVRAGRLRLSFHVSTSEQDSDLAAEVLAPHLRP